MRGSQHWRVCGEANIKAVIRERLWWLKAESRQKSRSKVQTLDVPREEPCGIWQWIKHRERGKEGTQVGSLPPYAAPHTFS